MNEKEYFVTFLISLIIVILIVSIPVYLIDKYNNEGRNQMNTDELLKRMSCDNQIISIKDDMKIESINNKQNFIELYFFDEENKKDSIIFNINDIILIDKDNKIILLKSRQYDYHYQLTDESFEELMTNINIIKLRLVQNGE